MNARTAALSSVSAKLQKHNKKVAIALALAVEWALAFAFAKTFADAVADANANADAQLANAHARLASRIAALEAEHGYTSHHEPGRGPSSRVGQPRRRPTTAEDDRG